MAGLGWHYDTGIHLLRSILAGVFDRFPKLQLITGHWGEVVLFYLERIAAVETIAATKLQRPIAEYFTTNISITPSGIFSERYLRWAMETVGPERILLSGDYPFHSAPEDGVEGYLARSGVDASDRELIASGNWKRLMANVRRSLATPPARAPRITLDARTTARSRQQADDSSTQRP